MLRRSHTFNLHGWDGLPHFNENGDPANAIIVFQCDECEKRQYFAYGPFTDFDMPAFARAYWHSLPKLTGFQTIHGVCPVCIEE